MSHFFLRAWNLPGLILIVLFGVAIQTSLFSYYPFLYLQPDIVLLAVIWCSLRRSFFEGGVCVIIFANIAEVHSAVPQGVYLMAYMAVFFTIRVLARYVLLRKLSALVGLTLFSSIFWKLSVLLITYLLTDKSEQWRHTVALLLPGAVVQGAVSVWIYKAFEKFDWVTFKDPRARQSMEDEFHLSEEGL